MARMQVTRRRMLQMVAVTAVTPLLAACGGGQAPAPAAPAKTDGAAAPKATTPAQPTQAPAQPTAQPAQAAPAQKSGDGVAIRALMSVGGSGKAFEGGLKLFNDRFKGQYRVEPEMIAIEALLEKEMSQFISGTPTYDVMSISTDWLGGVWHFLEPLNGYVQRDKMDFAATFGARVADAITYEGNLTGLPVRFGTDIMFYRKDILDAAGLQPPRTRDAFRKTAQQLTKKWPDGQVHTFGTSFKAQSPSWTVGSFGHFFLGAGGRFITQDGKEPHPSLNSPIARDSLDVIKAIIDDGSTPSALAWTYDDNVVAFQQGRVAMSDEYSARSLLIEDPAKSTAAGKMGYAPWMMEPLGSEPPTHYGSTWQFTVDKNSKNKDAAWELLKFMTSFEAQKMMALQFSNGSTTLQMYEDPDYVKFDPAAPAIKEVLAGSGWQPYYPVPQQAELQKIAHEEIQSFYAGQQTSAQATDKMAQRFQRALRQ